MKSSTHLETALSATLVSASLSYRLSQTLTSLVLITGPTPGGIGAETAITLARAKPKHMIFAGRTEGKIQPLINQINQEHPEIKISFLELDLSSQKSVRAGAERVKSLLAGDKITALILNAAIMMCPYSLTEDGVELQFATNHIGHFLFSNLLLRKELIGSRIVVVSSLASERKPSYLFSNLDDVTYNGGKTYDPVVAYSFSKASNVLYAKRLARLLKPKNITVFSLNPGSIRTNLQVHMTDETRNSAVAQLLKENPDFKYPQPKTLQQGAATQLCAALDPSLADDSGAYLNDCQVKHSSLLTEAEAFEDQIWELSEKLVGEKFDF
jgi:NAD(P)-dependent dehydrogenase (short-subunit alcohol dehydrogenase family)